ncbi:hypothetical protein I4F81_006079 [Pyropia yezoensis]|uniref:Uncharacterized protein n=1 Tax=Pyropia yezoensis TaxID=2788 RepID=A0ACC3BZL1_PYRYE|nr:hypothetical protein I4F81_006079 [Neopyropia yezoensis]
MVQVFVKTLAAGIAVVRDAATVGELRATAAAVSGVSSAELRLVGGTHELSEDALTLVDAGLVDGSTIYTALRVSDDGKVQRLRRECPHELCGAGIFMAAHKDRHYCGKCGLTYALDKEAAA